MTFRVHPEVNPRDLGGTDPAYEHAIKVIIEGAFPDRDVWLAIPHNDFFNTERARTSTPAGVLLVEVWSPVDEYHSNMRIYTGGNVMWGNGIPCADHPYPRYPEGEKPAIRIDSPEGVPVATLHSRYNDGNLDTLSIHWDITHMGYDTELAIMRELFNYVAQILNSGDGSPREIDYGAMVRAALEAKAKEAKEKVDTTNRYINSKKDELTSLYRRLEDAVREYNSISGSITEIINKTKEELNNLVEQYKVANVTVIGTDILVFTEDIIIETEEYGTHYIGKFRITIPMDSSDIRLYNLNNIRNGYWPGSHHPHIDSSGRPCWGNVATTVAQLHADRQYCALVNILIGYLESVNMDDPAGETVRVWGESIDSPAYDKVYTHECEECGEHMDENDVYWGGIEGDIAFCSEGCREDYEDRNYYRCEECGDYVDKDNAEEFDGHYFCSAGCMDNFIDYNYISCEQCGELIREDDAYDGRFCDEVCYDNYYDDEDDDDGSGYEEDEE